MLQNQKTIWDLVNKTLRLNCFLINFIKVLDICSQSWNSVTTLQHDYQNRLSHFGKELVGRFLTSTSTVKAQRKRKNTRSMQKALKSLKNVMFQHSFHKLQFWFYQKFLSVNVPNSLHLKQRRKSSSFGIELLSLQVSCRRQYPGYGQGLLIVSQSDNPLTDPPETLVTSTTSMAGRQRQYNLNHHGN